MADKLRLGPEVRELKIGQSFTSNKAGAFHALRYDFKPASVDINKIATVDIGTNNQVTVNVPHLDGAGVPQTVFKGSHKPFTKECVLIFDRITGEIVLEKLSSNIQVKKTRSEATRPILPQDRATNSSSSSSNDRGGLSNAPRAATPPIGQRQSNKTRVTSGSRRPDRQIMQIAKHSPLRASPNYSSPAHNTTKSPKRDRNTNPEAASLPMIGIDDFPEEAPPAPAPPPQIPNDWKQASQQRLSSQSDSDVPEMSDSSSSSSSSDSDSENEAKPTPKRTAAGANGHAHMNNGGSMNGTGKLPSLPATLLNDDLQLSESGSDFDDDDD